MSSLEVGQAAIVNPVVSGDVKESPHDRRAIPLLGPSSLGSSIRLREETSASGVDHGRAFILSLVDLH